MTIAHQKLYTVDDIYALPEGQRAELIDGQIYDMAPPARIHQHIIMNLSAMIHNHIQSKNGSCLVYPAPFAVFLNRDNRNYVEPDISVICDMNKLDDRGCNGAPDWVIEVVSPGSEKIDYGIKLYKYRSAGVREYWVINPRTRIVNIYDFEHEDKTGQYSFDDVIPVCIYEDLEIRMEGMMD